MFHSMSERRLIRRADLGAFRESSVVSRAGQESWANALLGHCQN